MIISELSSQERTGCLLTTVWNLKFITHPLFPTIVSSLASILDKTATLDICGQRYTGWGKGYTHPWVPGEADCTAGLRNRCGMQLTGRRACPSETREIACAVWSLIYFEVLWRLDPGRVQAESRDVTDLYGTVGEPRHGSAHKTLSACNLGSPFCSVWIVFLLFILESLVQWQPTKG